MKERRKDRRFHTPEKFQLKARVKKQSDSEVYYFTISDLSMGGICFVSESEKMIELSLGETIDIMIFRKNLSVRVSAEIVQAQGEDPAAVEKKLRAKIVGISDYGREVLAGFLKEMATE